ncbi:MAG TPA: GAF domain-containing sensor histidine kinase [Ktedonobacterales bacterium]
MNQPDTIPGTLRGAANVADSPRVRGIFSRLTSQSTAAESHASTSHPATRRTWRWLWLARVTWLGVATVGLISFFLSLPLNFAELEQVCTGSACDLLSLRPEHLPVLAAWGLSPAAFAAYGTVLGSVENLAWYAMGVLLFVRRSAKPRVLFFSFCLMVYGGGPSYQTLAVAPSSWWLPVTAYLFLGTTCCFTLFVVLFPTGQFVPRWTRPLALAWIVVQVPTSFFPDSPLSAATWPGAVQALVLLGFFGCFIVAWVYRYGWCSTPVERQQTKWVLLALGVLLLLIVARGTVGTLVLGGEAPPLWLVLVVGHVSVLATIFVPLSIAAAILRYRLWEVDRLINRTLVYGALTASVVGLYVLLVGALGGLFRSSDNPLLAILATGLVALLFHPLRQRVQRGVNRLLYGQRDEPYQVLARLGRQLETTLIPEAMLPTIVKTIAHALKLPYLAVRVKQGDEFKLAAAAGAPVGTPLSLPLIHQGEMIGQLLLTPRHLGEPLTPPDRRLLEDLLPQIGMAVHAVRLNADLQRSRERLVTAREEERRRLRRDLHDGIGPTLASLAQRLDTVARLVPRTPDTAIAELGHLKGQVKTTIAEIRRLVYALRPPVLDELGLLSALREHLAQLDQPEGLHLTLEAPEALPELSAAVEVAMYRIVLEALTNVVRHAHAQACLVHLELLDAKELCLSITDDGIGLPANLRAGVGITAMRERAAELGGTCQITACSLQGTRVDVRLPLAKE